MDKFFLVPNKEGLTVRDPLTGKALPKEGAWKPKTNYWLRRLQREEVAESKPTASDQPAPEAESQAQPDSTAVAAVKSPAKGGAAAKTSTDTKGDAQ